MTLVFYISGHGFGHATRSFEVIRALQQLDARVRIVLRCAVPEAFVRHSLGDSVTLMPVETDVGLVQVDSLELNASASANAANTFYAAFDQRIERELRLLSDERASLVIGDVPPLAFAAAARAGIPSVAIANFTWDWIYRAYPEFARIAPHTVDTIGQAYAETTLALRLPFAGGFDTMRAVRDIPLIARQSRYSREQARALLRLDPRRPIVLASFGGHGLSLPYEQIASTSRFTLLTTDYEAHAIGHTTTPNLVVVPGTTLDEGIIRYEDLVAAADIVVTKPGYGIVSECIANNTALLYTSRGPFPEYDVMTEQMSRFLKTRFLDQARLRAGDWNASIADLLAQPAPPDTMPAHGAFVAASSVLALASA
ncbi:MAG: hypothetical protein LBQ09_05505 [Acidobacteriaceae bacterium]|nr:hypothetical protein [Acidobacteriaceae bacterium]